MSNSKPDLSLKEALQSWEDYDDRLTTAENFIELQIQMGFLDKAKEQLKKYQLQ